MNRMVRMSGEISGVNDQAEDRKFVKYILKMAPKIRKMKELEVKNLQSQEDYFQPEK